MTRGRPFLSTAKLLRFLLFVLTFLVLRSWLGLLTLLRRRPGFRRRTRFRPLIRRSSLWRTVISRRRLRSAVVWLCSIFGWRRGTIIPRRRLIRLRSIGSWLIWAFRVRLRTIFRRWRRMIIAHWRLIRLRSIRSWLIRTFRIRLRTIFRRWRRTIISPRLRLIGHRLIGSRFLRSITWSGRSWLRPVGLRLVRLQAVVRLSGWRTVVPRRRPIRLYWVILRSRPVRGCGLTRWRRVSARAICGRIHRLIRRRIRRSIRHGRGRCGPGRRRLSH